ncbi:MAG: hypothetical protein EOM37_14560 [Proteobacteria bacterium]|nr:hypothetical protein [Pseudomonadota bacterium]
MVDNAAGRKVKQPYFISAPDSEVIVFAGLWSSWKSPDGTLVISCALLSKAAAPCIDHIHYRMLVVHKREHYEAWMDPRTEGQRVQGMIHDTVMDFSSYPVSTKVNSARNDYPELIVPIKA